MELTERDIILVRQAQTFCRTIKAKDGNVDCPFRFSDASFVCRTCHRWMDTKIRETPHPCSALDQETVVERFWRIPRRLEDG